MLRARGKEPLRHRGIRQWLAIAPSP